MFIAATRPEIAPFRKKTARVMAARQNLPLGRLHPRHFTAFEKREDSDRKSARADLRVYEGQVSGRSETAPGRARRRSEFQRGGKYYDEDIGDRRARRRSLDRHGMGAGRRRRRAGV